PDPSPAGRGKAQAAAARVAKRFGVRPIDRATLERFARENEQRTLYVFDVRTPEEFLAGHLAGSRSAPGGQLVQATDTYAATRNARIVLVDDDGVRATMTASWLVQMGLDQVFVLENGLAAAALDVGPENPRVLGLADIETVFVSAKEL